MTNQPLMQAIAEDDHTQGSPDAAIVLIVYGDYECPYTRRSMSNIRGLRRRFGDDLCFIFRHYPLPPKIHPQAWIASEAALCANSQGKFWEMHEHLFANQNALTNDDLTRYAQELGLNSDQFRVEMDGHIHNNRIERDLQGGRNSGVRSIPALFINNERYMEKVSLSAVASAMEQLL